jgi:trans-aconitate 2-methyltransferase
MARAADWDGSAYHQVAAPHAAWGANVLDRLELRGDERVLDAGCGSGRVTRQLVERVPRGQVIGVDLSPSMLTEARKTLAPVAERVTLIQTDLLEIERVLDAPVDAVFSTATFHWISDHDRLFGGLHRVLRPSGRLVAQFGGGDNLAGFMRATDAVAARPPYAAVLSGRALWRFYYSPETTRTRLESAGFTRVDAWLETSPQTFDDRQALADFCRAVVLSSHLAALPGELRESFLGEVVEQIVERQGGCMLDYVRLNVAAVG